MITAGTGVPFVCLFMLTQTPQTVQLIAALTRHLLLRTMDRGFHASVESGPGMADDDGAAVGSNQSRRRLAPLQCALWQWHAEVERSEGQARRRPAASPLDMMRITGLSRTSQDTCWAAECNRPTHQCSITGTALTLRRGGQPSASVPTARRCSHWVHGQRLAVPEVPVPRS